MTAKRTPFYERHIEAGAKIVDFAGYRMPMLYKGIVPEHLRVRQTAGIFDLSHMGEFFLEGAGAVDFISKMTTNDPTTVEIGQCQYSAMCYDNGGIVDDLLVYRLGDAEWMLVVNASNLEKDWEWLKNHLPENPDFSFENRSEEIGLLAIQGPDAQKILQKLTSYDLESMGFYHNARANIGGHEGVLFSRTGYTGEDGFELYLDPAICLDLWDKTLKAGAEFDVEPIGLGARDSLRLEMKYALYGNDIDQNTNPWEANLGWIVKLEKGDFIAREALIDAKTEGIGRKLVCFKLLERGFPRHGYPIRSSGEEIGVVTSGTHSPSLDIGVGMGYVKTGFHKPGTEIQIVIRDHPVRAIVEKPPLYTGGSHK
ncbi:MAG TPA: glycine cleavage system aminomethyltransferase GcvT [candidate division Zixibacteria bacterium]|nr:glycine cleavage system aminomethyltransferase GcvT [candidate division Zixibacteria bacterium]